MTYVGADDDLDDQGECTGSICLAYGLESCQCRQGPDDKPTKVIIIDL